MSVFSTYFGLSFNFGDISKPRRHGKWSDIFVVRISVLYWCNGSANLQNIWSIRVQPLFENLDTLDINSIDGIDNFPNKRTNWNADIHLMSTFAFLSQDLFSIK